jgi:predicted exporter
VSVTHYGWRSNLLSIYPNAVTIRPVAGPDVSLFPWLNIVILFGIVLILFFAWRIWERFEDRVIDPFVDRIAVRWAKMKDWAGGRR